MTFYLVRLQRAHTTHWALKATRGVLETPRAGRVGERSHRAPPATTHSQLLNPTRDGPCHPPPRHTAWDTPPEFHVCSTLAPGWSLAVLCGVLVLEGRPHLLVLTPLPQSHPQAGARQQPPGDGSCALWLHIQTRHKCQANGAVNEGGEKKRERDGDEEGWAPREEHKAHLSLGPPLLRAGLMQPQAEVRVPAARTAPDHSEGLGSGACPLHPHAALDVRQSCRLLPAEEIRNPAQTSTDWSFCPTATQATWVSST